MFDFIMEESGNVTSSFKKPVLIGKVGKLPKLITKEPSKVVESEQIVDFDSQRTIEVQPEEVPEPVKPPVKIEPSLTYNEPSWSGVPEEDLNYGIETLKLGAIIDQQKLVNKSYWIFGRLPQCDISMAHPTVSRHHAVLQYRAIEGPDTNSDTTCSEDIKGFYLYDLGSTHGTFLNKRRLKPHIYIKVQVGHMIKLGCSSRTFILTGPDSDREQESELTVTELKAKQQEQLEKRLEEESIRRDQLAKDAERPVLLLEKCEDDAEEQGVDWGLGEDADEETDLSENPYAQTNNEELYLDDPKKALRGFMEREGLSFEYDCQEQGIGQFICKVVLPIDDERGRPIVAEVVHKGKKKEAVVQCALEACRILDRHGILRQATHESKKRKAKNWEDDDFYDSDDDTFLDRTGSIERKRNLRMQARKPQGAETYQSLLEKERNIANQIKEIDGQLLSNRNQNQRKREVEDSLDAFMEDLQQPQLDKYKIMELKSKLARLKKEHVQVIKLVNIARPSNLPPLIPEYQKPASINVAQKNKFPLFGKKIKLKVEKPTRSEITESVDENDDEDEIHSIEKPSIPETKELDNGDNEAIKYKTVEVNDSPVKNKAIKDTQQKEAIATNSEDKISQPEADVELSKDEAEKRRKKNSRRIQQRQEKQGIVKQRGYEEDASKEDYNMWVPPEGQTGDGKTSLNAKYGY